MLLEIVTPEGRMEIRDATSIALPTRAGEITILEGHAPLLTLLEPGRLTVQQGHNRQRFVIATGSARIGPGRVSLLLMEFCAEEEIGYDAAMQRLQAAEKALSLHESAAHAGLREEQMREVRYAQELLALSLERG